MRTAWAEAIGTLSGVWVNARSGVSQKETLHLHALITATIEGRKEGHAVHSERACLGGEKDHCALPLGHGQQPHVSCWTGCRGQCCGLGLASTLLHSDGSLHLLQRRGNCEGRVISLSRLTELSAINSVLSTWAQKDIFFSSLSTPTVWLVAVFSGASSDDTWNDEYLCLNATVTNAAKVRYGLQMTGLDSRAIWPVNTRGDEVRHVFLSHDFTLVASVTIEVTPSENTPPLTAVLADTEPNHSMGLSCSHNKTWYTSIEGKTTTQSGTWEPKEEYQVALMLQGKKASAHIDGHLLA
ncbi:trans-sialidase, putative [Trypanosoma cruzi]|nr:trans-sialidase, putative [Trypanosoma cruzi]